MSTTRSRTPTDPVIVVLNAPEVLGGASAGTSDGASSLDHEVQHREVAISADMVDAICGLVPRREWILVCGSAPNNSPPLSASTWDPVATEAVAILRKHRRVQPPRGLALIARTEFGRVSQVDIDGFEMAARRLCRSFTDWRLQTGAHVGASEDEHDAMWFGAAGAGADPTGARGKNLVEWIESLGNVIAAHV